MIFEKKLQVNPSDPKAITKIANHIISLQEQLEYRLSNLDSSNITEIDTDQTTITNSTGTGSLGSYISEAGSSGESIIIGKNPNTGVLEFSIRGKNGLQMMYVDNEGNLVITRNANITIDGLNESISDLNESINALEERINTLEEPEQG